MKWTTLFIILLTSPCFAFLRADINRDHVVDMIDLAILAQEWLMSDLGPNLVTNGDFALGDNGDWLIQGEPVILVGSCQFGPNDAIYQPVLTIGKRYRTTLTVTVATTGYVQVAAGSAGGAERSTVGTFTEEVVCTGNTNFSVSSDSPASMVISNVSVKEIRSSTMSNFMFYRPSGDWCYRIVNPLLEQAWDRANSQMDAAPTYGDTAIELTHDANLGGYVVAIPDGLPDGVYDVAFYNVAFGAAAAGDSVSFGKRIQWNTRLNRFVKPVEIMLDM